ncbi:MAG TPA: hypothetical protein VGI82_10300 [Chitinophagaceae bacterium]|jgi:hypothetical protein
MKRAGFISTILFIALVYANCKHKKNDVSPAIDFIKGQIRSIDSSVDPIIELASRTDSTYDTTNLNREQFNDLAKEFSEAPDISKKFGGKYKEERMVDNDLGQAIFISTTDDKNLEIQRQEIRVTPDEPFSKINSVYLEKFKNTPDSSMIKRMTWYADWKFQIVTLTQKKDGAENTSIVEVIWKDKKDN